MKKSQLSLWGIIFFLVLLIVNWIFDISPENTPTIIAFIAIFFIIFFFQKRKEKST